MIAPDQANEIAQIERELLILRERYANFERGARWVQRFGSAGSIFLAAFGIVVLAATAKPLGFFYLLLGVAMWAGWTFLVDKEQIMDWVSMVRLGVWGSGDKRSEVRAVTRMIAEREQRLALLKPEAPSTP